MGADIVVIREATEADLPRLLDLYFQLSQLGSRPEDAPRPVTEAHRGALQALRTDPHVTCLVVELDGQVVGTLTMYVLANLSYGARPFAVIENVVTDVAVRGRGLGRLLMAHAEELARRQGCYRMVLTSHRRRTDAHRFYERLGFQRSHEGMTKYLDEEPGSPGAG
ncbi:MAG: GNAT family N-acetyltransferase [Chloroflexota bacterium]